MADPDLVHRAEQAYLGALLARQGRVGTGAVVAGDAGPDGFTGLRPQDFTDPVHQAIYAALAGQAARRPRILSGLYDRLRGLLSRLLRTRARDASAYMAGLRHRPAASRRPAPAAEAPASRTDRTAGELAPGVARLARALRADARSATQGAPGNTRTTVPPESQRAPLDAEALQERLLADLMRRPADGGDITSWLPDTVFTDGPHRSLYQLISIRLADGRPVDPLIIAWDASLLDDLGGTGGVSGATGESLAAATLRLGVLDPGPGTAAVLARPLYAEQLCIDTFGPDWPKEPGRIPALAMPPTPAPSARASAPVPDPAAGADLSRRSEPGPSAAGQAVTGATDRPDPSAAPAPETAKRAGAGLAADGQPVPALPRRAPSPPLQQPPVPGPAEPSPAQRM